MLKTIEPFAYGYINAKGSVSTKIAAGMYAVCENLPLDIDPEIRRNGSQCKENASEKEIKDRHHRNLANAFFR